MNDELDRLARTHLAELHERLLARNMGGRVGFGTRPAILVVDFIKAFTDERCPLASDYATELAATRRILDVGRERGIPIVLTTSSYDPELSDGGVWARKIPANEWMTEGTEWVDIDERLGSASDDMLLTKKYASCFYGTDLASRLVSRQVDTLIVMGCTTSGCVRASTVDACSLGLRTIVVEDAVGDRAPLSHLTSLFDIDVKYGDVVGSEAVVEHLA